MQQLPRDGLEPPTLSNEVKRLKEEYSVKIKEFKRNRPSPCREVTQQGDQF